MQADREIKPTEQEHERFQRDHPLESPQKSYHTVLEQQLQLATEELDRPSLALLLTGLSAGLDLGFGPFAMAVIATKLKGVWPTPVVEILSANAYTIGFLLVVLGRSSLFTEHTTAAVLPVLAKRASIRRLLRLWALVLVANLVGATLFAVFASLLGPALGVTTPEAFGEIAFKVVRHPWNVMFFSAIGAGWLMGLLVWLVTAARDTISQVFIIWMTTLMIGLAGLHHSIAGTSEVLLGVFVGKGAGWGDFATFQVWSVIGNAIGGALFVALLKFAHVQLVRDGMKP